jgi:transposase-like protein
MIVTWCRFSLSLWDLEELMSERRVAVDDLTLGSAVRSGGAAAAARPTAIKIVYLAYG